jgi:DNA-binding transcriptional ArsR family regulator
MDVFGALADPIRRSLLEELAAGPSRVVDLATSRPISRPAVSKHLRLLSEAGLVEAADHGRERHYRLRAEGLLPAEEFLAGLAPGPLASPAFAQALEALDTEVRRTLRERRTAVSSSTNPREETA